MDLAGPLGDPMEVSCPACAARYTADDEKLRGKTARMRCRACDTVWLVSGPSLDGGERRRAAVARRRTERERRDLFASRPPEHGCVRETLRPPPSTLAPPSGGVAARNENSVLFRVDDVFGGSGNARVKTPEPSPVRTSPLGSAAPARKDDSGIIDLKALSSMPPKAGRPPVANLFGASDAPPPAFTREVSPSASSYPLAGVVATLAAKAPRLRTYGGIAAVASVVAICGLGVALVFGGENPPPKAATALVLEPPPAPALATPPPAAAESASPTDVPSAEPKATASSSKAKHHGTRGHHGKGGATITSKSAPPPPKKIKPADPCGCHGDFNCILACTAGRKR